MRNTVITTVTAILWRAYIVLVCLWGLFWLLMYMANTDNIQTYPITLVLILVLGPPLAILLLLRLALWIFTGK